jgi:hypothetical protein
MSLGSGGCGGPQPIPVPHPFSRPKPQEAGKYAVDLGPILSVSLPIQIWDGLTLVLLTTAPSPEGVGAVELVAEGYERQPVSLMQLDSRYDGSRHKVLFGPVQDWQRATHMALLDPAGYLIAYGALRPNGQSFDYDDQGFLVFLAGQVRVKRMHGAGA